MQKSAVWHNKIIVYYYGEPYSGPNWPHNFHYSCTIPMNRRAQVSSYLAELNMRYFLLQWAVGWVIPASQDTSLFKWDAGKEWPTAYWSKKIAQVQLDMRS